MTKGYHDHAELQERQRNMMKEFLDIIETTYDISDDVESINDMMQSDLYDAWIKSVCEDETLASEEKANQLERIAKSYREEQLRCEEIICNERKERTDNMIRIFQKVVFPTLIIITIFTSVNSVSKLPQFQKKIEKFSSKSENPVK